MDTGFDTPPARNTRSRFNSPPASNTRSRTASYPVPKPELNSDRTSTSKHPTAATPLIRDRSVLQSQKVSKEQLMTLILSDGLSNDISYEVHDLIQISDCPGLKFLSGNIATTSALFIDNCPELRTISANLFVGGGILIRNCPLLERIDGSVTVKSDLHALHMPSLVDLPGTFSIGGTLQLSHSSHLRDLSGTFCIGGALQLSDCSHLSDLSGNFSVQGNAAFSHCRRLSNASGQFIVGDKLDLSYCPHLTSLSGDFSVGRHIDLNHCIRLKVVPDWITTLGSHNSRAPLTVDLEYTGLSDADIDQLYCAEIPGVRFDTTDEATIRTRKLFDNLPEALAFWWDLACSHRNPPRLNLQPEQAEDMLDFLEQLTWTREYSNENYQPVLAQRVLQAITLVVMDDRLREEALIHISKGATSFDEVVSIGLETLEDMLQDNRLPSYGEYLDEQSSGSSA